MKYLVVNLKKKLIYTALCSKNYKTFDKILMEGIKEDLNKWGDRYCVCRLEDSTC